MGLWKYFKFSILVIVFFTFGGNTGILGQTHENDLVHGFGISNFSKYDTLGSYLNSRENALEDLKASLFTSVILEYYGTNTLNVRLKTEFSILDSINTDQEILEEYFIDDDVIVVILKLEDERFSKYFQSNYLELEKLNSLVTTIKSGNWWLAYGDASYSVFNPNDSCVNAKQDALKNLSTHLGSKIQSVQSEFNDDFSSITYLTSKTIFKNIIVVYREMKEDKCKVKIAVNLNDILKF